MKDIYYDTIFKRKSFHLFRGLKDEKITEDELANIKKAYENFESLCPDIKTDIRIMPAKNIYFKRDAEYCILIYSEKKDNYLMNAGYIGQQLDLYLTKNNIGSLWYGLGKPDQQTYNNLEYVIMFAIKKVSDQSKYRIDMFKAKRKPLDEIWKGEDLNVANIARFAPSACNSQPWYVENENDTLTVYRYKKDKKIGLLTHKAALYFNRIDIGIYLCILEICLEKNQIKYTKSLFVDEGTNDELTKVAVYKLLDVPQK